MGYPITVNLIPNLPQKPYRNGVGAYEGVVAHATDTYNDSDEGERNYELSHWREAYVHFFVDEDSITQVADTNYLAWGAGNVANPRYVHVELCQSYDAAKFAAAYARYTWLLAKLLYDRKLGVTMQSTLWGHDDVTNVLGGTTHSDPYDYLDSHGVSKDKFYQDVINEYLAMHTAEIAAAAAAKAQAQAPVADIKPPTPVTNAPTIIGVAEVIVNGLNVRKGNSFTAPILRVAPKGEKFNVWGVSNGMYDVAGGYFISANPSYVKFTKGAKM